MSKIVTAAELAEHSDRANRLWMLIHGNVYDVTDFIEEHPGGEEVIIENGNVNATESFEDVGHSDDARNMLDNMLVGRLEGALEDKSKRNVLPSAEHVPVQSQGSAVRFILPFVAIIGFLVYRAYA